MTSGKGYVQEWFVAHESLSCALLLYPATTSSTVLQAMLCRSETELCRCPTNLCGGATFVAGSRLLSLLSVRCAVQSGRNTCNRSSHTTQTYRQADTNNLDPNFAGPCLALLDPAGGGPGERSVLIYLACCRLDGQFKLRERHD